MRFELRLAAVVVALVVLGWLGAGVARGQTSAFTYQGSLSDGAAAADGGYDLRFDLFAGETGGTSLGAVDAGGSRSGRSTGWQLREAPDGGVLEVFSIADIGNAP